MCHASDQALLAAAPPAQARQAPCTHRHRRQPEKARTLHSSCCSWSGTACIAALTLAPGVQVANGDCPHTLFYGPPGAGKKTLIIALLREIFGPSVEKARRPPCASALAALGSSPPVLSACAGGQVRVETRPWKIALPSSNIEVELTTVSSNYHVEMNPSDVGNRDRHIVQEVIKARGPGGRILLSCSGGAPGHAAPPSLQRAARPRPRRRCARIGRSSCAGSAATRC